MAVEITIDGVRVGLARPLALGGAVLLAPVVGWLVLRGTGMMDRSSRRRLLFARLLVVVLLVGAVAGPYTVTRQAALTDPTVTVLVDRSQSMQPMPTVTDELTNGLEEEGVTVRTVTVGSGNKSRIGDGVVSALSENGSVLLVSDGQVTGGQSLQASAEFARGLNATVNAVTMTPQTTERYVLVNGPRKTSVGVDNRFLARTDGVELDDERITLTVTVDGEVTNSTTGTGAQSKRFSYTFQEPGTHNITARVTGEDGYQINDVFRRTVRVVEPPPVLYVSKRSFPLEDVLGELYDLETAAGVPADLSPYLAVVVQDVPAGEVGNASALQRSVIDGNGVVVVGGENAYDLGGYEGSQLVEMLPVSVGAGGRTATIVLVVDISGSVADELDVQKGLALDVVDQLGDANRVGLVAFDGQAYRIADVHPLEGSREQLTDRIRRLQNGRGTDLSAGLAGAGEMLGDRTGTIILLSDGHDQGTGTVSEARELGRAGNRVITVSPGGGADESHLQAIADAGGGLYLRGDETDRLRILFGGSSRQFSGEGLTIVDANHFITRGVDTTASPARINTVSVRQGADYLVAGPDAEPAVAAWHYGLGRSVSITAYGADGTLDGLLTEPDSLLVTKSVNWAIGDPERKADSSIEVPDARVGDETTVTVTADDRPTAGDIQFRQIGDRTYQATLVPARPGYATVLAESYAVNYPREYGGFGQTNDLSDAVAATGGGRFDPDDTADIADAVRRQTSQVQSVRTEWDTALLVLALLVFLAEVAGRRIAAIRRSEA